MNRLVFVACATAFAAACATSPPRAPDARVADAAAEAERPVDDAGALAAETGDAGDDADDAGMLADDVAPADEERPCPEGMTLVAREGGVAYCIDVYEASLVEVAEDGSEQPYPHYLPVDGHAVRAVSVAGAWPQGYISELQARDACGASGKRLCNLDEWKTACEGSRHATFPYGDARQPAVCNDHGRSAVLAVFGAKAVAASTSFLPPRRPPPNASTKKPAKDAKDAKKTDAKKRASTVKGRGAVTVVTRKGAKPETPTTKTAPKKRIPGRPSARPRNVDPGVWAKLNDPRLGQVDGTLARTGEHAACVAESGALDMVGNLHEWVATDPAAPHGTFAGGYYLDTSQNGDGCRYRTVAHAHDYHDYSTGFRCCADARARP